MVLTTSTNCLDTFFPFCFDFFRFLPLFSTVFHLPNIDFDYFFLIFVLLRLLLFNFSAFLPLVDLSISPSVFHNRPLWVVVEQGCRTIISLPSVFCYFVQMFQPSSDTTMFFNIFIPSGFFQDFLLYFFLIFFLHATVGIILIIPIVPCLLKYFLLFPIVRHFRLLDLFILFRLLDFLYIPTQ